MSKRKDRHLKPVPESVIPGRDVMAPPKKRRKKRLKLGRWRPKAYRNNFILHDYEEGVIEGDILALYVEKDMAESDAFTITALMHYRPERYDQQYLKLALARMAKKGTIYAGGWSPSRFSRLYRLPQGSSMRRSLKRMQPKRKTA